ncbi:DUF4194 domain-containing protein [Arthrobacter sp.]|uniref:DUF4194 domain-containing protein n=1 Tax=Arthrobacter sp. TaxID=1667 RepID=UPI0026DEED89|nr:DUF4194 domain-containing protein [Arthrobacter sp.]MDO5754065.1 DUF4194 domain-containing protein [Arthrobacter sp.]
MSSPNETSPAPAGGSFSSENSQDGSERTLFAGDTGSFPLELRQALVRLLRGPYIDGTTDPALWTTILNHTASLQQYLSEIFLLLTVDSERKIALLTPASIDAVHTQPIVARKPLRREETLLALRLRVLLDRHAGTGTDVGISRAGAREILAEHRQPGAVDDKRLDEQTDAALARLAGLKLIAPTELADEYRVSNALALALPFDSIDQIPAYLAALDKSAITEPFEDTLMQETF